MQGATFAEWLKGMGSALKQRAYGVSVRMENLLEPMIDKGNMYELLLVCG